MIILSIISLLVGVLAIINIEFVNFGIIILGIIEIIHMTTVPAPLPLIPYHYSPLLWTGPPVVLIGGILGVITSLVLKEK